MAEPQWRLLTSSLKVRGSPTLLIKHETQQHNGKVSRLRVCVTDLTYLWMEVLERKDLVLKACETSIDPVEQFDTLLEYINKGLNLAPRTSLRLRSERGRSHLVLRLTSPLPEPLQPLEWNFDLKQASELDFTREFVIPLMGNLLEAQQSVLDLNGIIADKDKAIERIDTELKTQDMQTTNLFDKRFYGEGVAEKHKKGILMNKVPGLRPHDPAKFQEVRSERGLPSIRDLNKLLFAAGLDCRTASHAMGHQAWWEDLGNGVEVEEPSQISQPLTLRKDFTSVFMTAGGDTRRSGLQPNGSDSSPPSEIHNTPMKDDDRGNESDATASTSSDVESLISRPEPRRIGKIGGSKTAPEEPARTRAPKESSVAQPIQAASSRAIGKIRGPHVPLNQDNEPRVGLAQSDQATKRPISPEAPTSIGQAQQGDETEDAEQIADRNRAKLRHELEEKRKAPVKKKRKF